MSYSQAVTPAAGPSHPPSSAFSPSDRESLLSEFRYPAASELGSPEADVPPFVDSVSGRLRSRITVPAPWIVCCQFTVMAAAIEVLSVLSMIAGQERMVAAHSRFSHFVLTFFLPLAAVQLLSPFWVHQHLTYSFRVAVSSVLAVAGLSLISFEDKISFVYTGLILVSIASAVLQQTVLGLSGFSNTSASLWACAGSGLGRLAGPLLYIGANSYGCEPSHGPWHTLGKGCFFDSHRTQSSPSHILFAVVSIACVALLCVAFWFTSVPMDFSETWQPQTFTQNVVRSCIRIKKRRSNTAAENELQNPAGMLDVLSQPTALVGRQIVRLGVTMLVLSWPLFVCSAVCAIMLYGVTPSLGRISFRDSIPLSQHHTYYLLALTASDGVTRCLLAFGDVMSRNVPQSGKVVFRHKSVFALISVTSAVGVGALAYDRNSANFAAIVILLILAGTCSGFSWLCSIQWLSRFGCRLHDDVNDTVYTTLLRTGAVGENVLEIEFALTLLPAFASLAWLLGASVAMPLLSYLTEHCLVLYRDFSSEMCFDRPL